MSGIIIFIFFWVNIKWMSFDLWNFGKAILLRKIGTSTKHAQREREFSYCRVTKSVKIHHWNTLHTLSDITPSNLWIASHNDRNIPPADNESGAARTDVTRVINTARKWEIHPGWRPPTGSRRAIRSVTLPIVFNEHLNLQRGFNFDVLVIRYV